MVLVTIADDKRLHSNSEKRVTVTDSSNELSFRFEKFADAPPLNKQFNHCEDGSICNDDGNHRSINSKCLGFLTTIPEMLIINQ